MSFDSFNISRGTGYWKGKREDSMTVEIICGTLIQDRIAAYATADSIRQANNQEAVYFTAQDIQAELIYSMISAQSLLETALVVV